MNFEVVVESVTDTPKSLTRRMKMLTIFMKNLKV